MDNKTKIHQGYIKQFYLEKGYGFIYSPTIKKSVFFCLNHIQNEGFIIPKRGDLVTFKIVKNEKGFVAIEVYINKRN